MAHELSQEDQALLRELMHQVEAEAPAWARADSETFKDYRAEALSARLKSQVELDDTFAQRITEHWMRVALDDASLEELMRRVEEQLNRSPSEAEEAIVLATLYTTNDLNQAVAAIERGS